MADLFIYLIVAAKPIIYHSSALLPIPCCLWSAHISSARAMPSVFYLNGPLPDLCTSGFDASWRFQRLCGII